MDYLLTSENKVFFHYKKEFFNHKKILYSFEKT